MKSKLWIAGFMILVVATLCTVGYLTVKIDPYFHFHKPDTSKYYYLLYNQRSQNDGITRHFDYDALITGTSMTENFKTSEMDALFGVKSIKVPYSGGSYKEINDSISRALAYNPNLKCVVRALDMDYFFDDVDHMRQDLGEYPTYLYDRALYNDVKYIFNREILFNRIYTMMTETRRENFVPGITAFDDYSNWMKSYQFGIQTVCPQGIVDVTPAETVHMTDWERQQVNALVEKQVISLAKAHPDVEFYYFFPPYSAVWWKSLVDNGQIYRQIEAERTCIERILECENIRLFSFNNLTEITTDLNNYKDTGHYGEWINSLILRYMKEDQYRLTPENYRDYLDRELAFYTAYDYSQMADEADYENDYYAAALLNEKISGVAPLDISASLEEKVELSCASIVENQHDGTKGIQCMGALQREPESEIALSEYIATMGYVGGKIAIDDISAYRYLEFYGMKNRDHGQPYVAIYDRSGKKVADFYLSYHDLDGEWHQYLMDVSALSGEVTIAFNGGYIDSTGDANSLYTFSDITLY